MAFESTELPHSQGIIVLGPCEAQGGQQGVISLPDQEGGPGGAGLCSQSCWQAEAGPGRSPVFRFRLGGQSPQPIVQQRGRQRF